MNYLSLDIGTTTIKGILYDEKGNVVKQACAESKTISPEVGYMEQNPDEVITFAYGVIRELVDYTKINGEEIGFLSLSSYMHSIMAVDSKYIPMTNILLWSDNRSHEFARIYKNNGLGLQFYKETGTPIHPMSPLYKLMWIKDREPEIFRNAHKFISMKGYLVQKITGKCFVDHSLASATGIFNIHEHKWDEEVLNEIGITADRLENPVETTTVLDITGDDFIKHTGLKSDTKLIIGASDGCLANLGSHGLDAGTGVVTIGTSGAVRVVTDRPVIEPNGRLFSYILANDFYVSGGALNNGGIVFQWFKELFNEDFNLDEIFYDYTNINNGLLFLPFLNGERAPYWNPKLKGSYLGINHDHDQKDFLYATIQGINFGIKDVLSILEESGSKVDKVFANGGFTKSDFWVNRLSAILDRPVNVLDQGDAACFGAYLLGLKAIGIISSWSECSGYFRNSKEYHSPNLAIDDAMFSLYKQSIENNMKVFSSLSDLQTRNWKKN